MKLGGSLAFLTFAVATNDVERESLIRNRNERYVVRR
jgi:hypothetical protein